MLKKKIIFVGTLAALLAFSGCGSSSDTSGTEDSSASGSVASVVGGAYNGSSSSGTQTMNQKAELKSFSPHLTPFIKRMPQPPALPFQPQPVERLKLIVAVALEALQRPGVEASPTLARAQPSREQSRTEPLGPMPMVQPSP
jgi:hypothetical protein